MPPKAVDLRAQLEDDEEDDQEELLAALHAMQAKKVRANLRKQEGLVAQGAELVRQYQESVRKLVEEEEGAIQARIQQYNEEKARIAKEARETEKTLLDLLHSQAISVRSATVAIEQELDAEREDARKIAHAFVQVTQGEKVDVDDVAPALWRMSDEQDGGDAMEGVED
ncbi:meiotic PUF protein 1 [Rhodotorula toruloides]